MILMRLLVGRNVIFGHIVNLVVCIISTPSWEVVIRPPGSEEQRAPAKWCGPVISSCRSYLQCPYLENTHYRDTPTLHIAASNVYLFFKYIVWAKTFKQTMRYKDRIKPWHLKMCRRRNHLTWKSTSINREVKIKVNEIHKTNKQNL